MADNNISALGEDNTFVKFKYGGWDSGNGLPDSPTNGVVYIAKAADGKAYMYVDTPDGERVNISSPNSTFFATCTNAATALIKDISCPGLELIDGVQLTVQFTYGLTLKPSNTYKLKVNNVETVLNLSFQSHTTTDTIYTGAVTFIYHQNAWHILRGMEDWSGPIWFNAFNANDGKKHYFTATSTESRMYGGISPVQGANAPYFKNSQLVVPQRLQIGETDDYGEPVDGAQALYFNTDHIRWSGYNDWYGNYNSDWRLYNNGSALELFENNIAGYKRLSIRLHDMYLYDTVYINWGNLHIEDGSLSVYDNITAYNDIYASGNLYHQGSVRVPRVYSGSTTPSSSLGAEGDIYIMYS